MYLFKTKKVCNVIYCQSFLKAFENGNNTQHGKLLRFLWSQPPEEYYKKRCSYKFRKIHWKTPESESLF